MKKDKLTHVCIKDLQEFIERDCNRIILRMNGVISSEKSWMIEEKLCLNISFESFRKGYIQLLDSLKKKKKALEKAYKKKMVCGRVVPVFEDRCFGSYVRIIAHLYPL